MLPMSATISLASHPAQVSYFATEHIAWSDSPRVLVHAWCETYIDVRDIVGQATQLVLQRDGDTVWSFSGIATKASMLGERDGQLHYTLTLEPAVARLQWNQLNRIF